MQGTEKSDGNHQHFRISFIIEYILLLMMIMQLQKNVRPSEISKQGY